MLCNSSFPSWPWCESSPGSVSHSFDSAVQCPCLGASFFLAAITLHLWSSSCQLRRTGSSHGCSPDGCTAGSLSIWEWPLPGSTVTRSSWRGVSRGIACGDRPVCDLASQYGPRVDVGQLVPHTWNRLPDESRHLSDEPGTDGDRAHIGKSLWNRLAGDWVSANAWSYLWGPSAVWGTRGILQSGQHDRTQRHGAGGWIQWLVSQWRDGHFGTASWVLSSGRVSDLSDRWLPWRDLSWKLGSRSLGNQWLGGAANDHQ